MLAIPSFAKLRHRVKNARAWLANDPNYIKAGKTPFEVIYEEDIVRVRYYPPLAEKNIVVDGVQYPCAQKSHRVPLVIVAPLAVNMLIYDLFPQRSLVRFLRAHGFELYLIDWGNPTRRHNHHTLSTYFASFMPRLLTHIRQHSGSEELSLHGWSMGGIFSISYTALSEDKNIRNMVLVGTPCDYHDNGVIGEQYKRISRTLSWVRNTTGLRAHNMPSALWRSPGWANSLAFKLTSPANSLKGYWELIRQLDDDEFVNNHATNSAFLDHMVAYPGGVLQDATHFLCVNNVMAQNRLPMAGNHTFTPVQSNLLFINGQHDTIVRPECTRPFQDMVSSKDQHMEVVTGGHVGIVSGRFAPAESWPLIAEWLAARSN